MKKILYFIGVGGVFYFSSIYHSPGYLFLGFFMLALALFSFLLLFRQRKYFKMETSVNPLYVTEGDPLNLTFHFNQHPSFPIYKVTFQVVVEDAFTKQQNKIFKSIKNTKLHNSTYTFPIQTNTCGLLHCTPGKIYLYDWLSIFKLKVKETNQYYMTVLPKQYPIYVQIDPLAPVPSLESELTDNNRFGDDSSEIYQFRTYRNGDSLSRVHWKLSARSEDYIVKEFSSKEPAGSAIFLDLNDQKAFESNANLYYKIIYSISLCLLDNAMFHYIMWIDNETGNLEYQHITCKNDLLDYMIILLSLPTYSETLDTHQILENKISSEILCSILYLDSSLSLKKGSTELYQFTKNSFSKDETPIYI